MEFSIKFDTVKSGWSIVYIKVSQVIFFKTYCFSFSELSWAFHLPRYLFRGFFKCFAYWVNLHMFKLSADFFCQAVWILDEV